MQILHFPAPRRCSVEVENKKYHTKKWDLKNVRDYLKAGGWFRPGDHEFQTRIAAAYAYSGGDISTFSDLQLKALKSEMTKEE